MEFANKSRDTSWEFTKRMHFSIPFIQDVLKLLLEFLGVILLLRLMHLKFQHQRIPMA